MADCCQGDRGQVAAHQLQADISNPLQPPYHSKLRTTRTSFSRIFLKSFQSLSTACYHPSPLIPRDNIKTMNYNDYANDEWSSVTECDCGCSESPTSSDARTTAQKTRRKVNNNKADAFDDFRQLFDEYRPLIKKPWGTAKRKLTRQHNEDRALVRREHSPADREYEWFEFAVLFAVLYIYVALFGDAKEDLKELLGLGMRMSVWLGFRTRLKLD